MLRDTWEHNAEAWIRWAREPGHDSYWRFHRDRFLELVPAPGRLTLDIGCGGGGLSRDLAALGHRVVGIDSSARVIAPARERSPELEVIGSTAADMPNEGETIHVPDACRPLTDHDS